MTGASSWRNVCLASAVVVLFVLVAIPRSIAQPTTTRPVEDFVNAQRTTTGWTDPARNLIVVVDYAGQRNRAIMAQGGASLGTIIRGTITERPLPDGRAEVTVVLETTRAFTVVIDFPPGGPLGPTYFGYRVPEVVAGADAALSQSWFRLVFKNTGVGDPLPDISQIDTQDIVSIAITSDGQGVFREAFGVPEGTPGRAQVTQVGLFMTAFQGATADGFPAEHVLLRVVGH